MVLFVAKFVQTRTCCGAPEFHVLLPSALAESAYGARHRQILLVKAGKEGLAHNAHKLVIFRQMLFFCHAHGKVKVLRHVFVFHRV